MMRLVAASLLAFVLFSPAFGQGYSTGGYGPPAGSATEVETSAIQDFGTSIYGGKILTQRDMRPKWCIRIDDFRDDSVQSLTPFITAGLDITLMVNFGNWNQGRKDDAVFLMQLAEQYGTTIEWGQHGNTNFDPTKHGDPAYVDPGNDDYTDFVEMTYEDWDAEFDPSALEAFTGSDVKLIQWNGDNNSRIVDFMRRNPELAKHFMEKYDFVAASSLALVSPTPNGELTHYNTYYGHTQVASDQLHSNSGSSSTARFDMARHEDYAWDVYGFILNMDFLAVERSGTEPWSTVDSEWSYNTKLPFQPITDKNGGSFAGFDNGYTDFRNMYSKALMAGGSAMWYGHSPADGELVAKGFPYPTATAANNDPVLYPGYTGSWWHTASVLRRLEDFGFIDFVTVSEAMKWRASTPGTPGLRVAGWADGEIRFPSHEIGDTHGVSPNWPWAELGSRNHSGSAQAWSNVWSAQFIDSTPEDGQIDGMVGFDEDLSAQTGANWTGYNSAGYYGRGKHNTGINDGSQPRIYTEWPNIYPGKYRITIRWQGSPTFASTGGNDLKVYAFTEAKWPYWDLATAGYTMATVHRDTLLSYDLITDPFSYTFSAPDADTLDPYGEWHEWTFDFELPHVQPTSFYDPSLVFGTPGSPTGIYNHLDDLDLRSPEAGDHWHYNISWATQFLAGPGNRIIIDEYSLRWMGEPDN